MIVAVTGASGFLGRRVLEKAAARGWRLRALSRTPWAAPDGVDVVVGDLSMPAAAASLFRGADAYVHLAAVGVQSRDRDWAPAVDTNTRHLLSWLQAGHDGGVARAVVVGTCLEYRGHGTLPDHPWEGEAAPRCREDASLESSSAYGATKAAGGLLARAWARASGAGLWYLRLPSLYGPGDDPAKFVPSAVRAARHGEAFPMSPGAQVREWLWVDDAAEAIVLAAQRDPGPGQTVNVGTGEGVSLEALARRLFRLAGRDEELVRPGGFDYRQGEVHHLVMDPTLAHRSLGWSPRTALDDGLRALVAPDG